MKLCEIEPGKWIVPELVTAVEAVYNPISWSCHVAIHMLAGDVQVRLYFAPSVDTVEIPMQSPRQIYAEDLSARGERDAREIAAWIDERRVEPLTLEKT